MISLRISMMISLKNIDKKILINQKSHKCKKIRGCVQTQPLIAYANLLLFQHENFAVKRLGVFYVYAVLGKICAAFCEASVFRFCLVNRIFVKPREF